MTLDVRHPFVSGKGDGPDTSLVRPSNWNAAHAMNMTGPALLGRDTADIGTVNELALGEGLGFVGGQLAVVSSSIPVGTVVDYAGISAPSKWLLCYGQAVSRITYTELFVAIGSTYGAGDGTNTFNVPDLRGRVRAGKDDMGGTSADRLIDPLNGDTLGASGGAEKHILLAAELPVHTHTGTVASAGAHRHFVANTDAIVDSSPSIAAGQRISQSNDSSGNNSYKLNASTREPTLGETSSGGAHTHTFTTDAAGANSAATIVQPTMVLNSIIYAGV